MFNPLEYPLCLQSPQHLTEISAWHEHIPFAFMLVQLLRPRVFVELGVHQGDSYCAFCQAVDQLAIDTVCYGIDTWKGDEQAGYYDESVFEALKRYHDRNYSKFSTLIRSTFDEALDHFGDGSIDLLHLDGLHTYDAVKHDFESWLPKLSPTGVVLLHDIRVRERDFGVWRLWDELKERYPSFELSHGHGLGLLVVGQHVSPALQALIGAPNLPAVRAFFSRLGGQLAQLFQSERQLSELQAARVNLSNRLAEHETELQNQGHQIGQLQQQFEQREAEPQEQRRQIEQLEQQLAERINQIKNQGRQFGQLKQLLQQQESELEDQRRNIEQLQTQLAQLRADYADKESRLLSLEHQRDRALSDLRALEQTRTVRLSTALATRVRSLEFGLKALVKIGGPIRGAIDTPDHGRSISGALTVSGWAVSVPARVQQVEVLLGHDPEPLGTLSYGIERPDVARAFPWKKEVQYGFEGTVELGSVAPGPTTLTIRVTDTAGNRCDLMREIVVEEPTLSESSRAGVDTAKALGQPGDTVIAQSFEAVGQARLRSFLATDQRITFPQATNPLVSIVIPTFNKAHFTLAALESLLATSDGSAPYEVIIVDNASTDETRALLERLSNVEVHRSDWNQGFGAACNLGAERARGTFICFLNSDVVVTPGWLNALIETAESYPTCGAVGAKLVHTQGTLQEAGGIIWRDGSCLGYGRGEDPLAPEFNFVREVDYCSAACLLVRRDLFEQLNGFDDQYAPAYYEDTDLCMGIRSAGYKVVYQPQSVVFHMEFGSSDPAKAIGLQIRNREKFVRKWRDELTSQYEPKLSNRLRARDRCPGFRVLVIDDKVPHAYFGSGFPRAWELLRALTKLGYTVSFLPVLPLEPRIEDTATGLMQQQGIEVLYGAVDCVTILETRAGLYDVVIISRPHNARLIEVVKQHNPNAAVLYDAEAVFAMRDALQLRVEGRALSAEEEAARIRQELAPVAAVDVVITVSETERRLIQEYYPDASILVWGDSISTRRPTVSVSARQGLIFVGYLATPPNADAVRHLLNDILPIIRERLDCQLTIVGADPPPEVVAAACKLADSVVMSGYVEDLGAALDKARIFLAPHRFAAGVPRKVIDAMANGIPCVVSGLLGQQLAITDGVEALVANDAREFAEKVCDLYHDEALWTRIQENGLRFVQERYDPLVQIESLRECIEGAIAAKTATKNPAHTCDSNSSVPTLNSASSHEQGRLDFTNREMDGSTMPKFEGSLADVNGTD